MKMNKIATTILALSIGLVVFLEAGDKKKHEMRRQKEDELKSAHKEKLSGLRHEKEIAELEYKKDLENLRHKERQLDNKYEGDKGNYEYKKQKAAINLERNKLKNGYELKIINSKHKEDLETIDYTSKRRALKEKE